MKTPAFAPALSPFLIRKLEDRILFDAVVDPLLVGTGDVGHDQPVNTPSQAFEAAMQASDAGAATGHNAAPASSATQARRELVIVDTSVQGYQQILQDVMNGSDSSRSLEVLLLNANQDGIEQLTDQLAGYHDLDAIHLISHGEAGAVKIGHTWLSQANINQYADQIQAWGSALTEQGDLLIYGCDFAATEVGRSVANTIANLASADLASSDDETGADFRYADWTFEYQVGTIETSLAFSQRFQQTYAHVFAAGPAVSISNISSATIGQDFSFNLTFENTGSQAGYGPIVDLIIPASAQTQGGFGIVGGEGLSFNHALYLGQTLSATEIVFPDNGDGTGTVAHPYFKDAAGNALTVTGNAGDRLVVIQLPMNSIAAGQSVSIQIDASVSSAASANQPLAIQARSGFQFGVDPLDNPTSDPASLSDTTNDVTDWRSPGRHWAEQATITPRPEGIRITKTLLSTGIMNGSNGLTDVVIGEVATYEVKVYLANQNYQALRVVDTLDQGLSFATQLYADMTGAQASQFLFPIVVRNSQNITWDLGDVTDDNLADGQGGVITLRYQTLTLNVSANQEGRSLGSLSTVTYNNDPTTAVTATATSLTVRESSVAVTESVSINGVLNATAGRVGDSMQYRYVLRNTGLIDAYDVTFQTALPRLASGNSVINSPRISVVDSSNILTSGDFVLSGSPTTGYTVALRNNGPLDLLYSQTGRTVTVVIDGTIASGVEPNQIIANRADVTWTSLDGARATASNDGERDGSNPAVNTADYATFSTASFAIEAPAFVKALFDTNQTETSGNHVTIGEVATYALLVNLSEGTTAGLIATDLLPAGLSYLGYSIVTSAAASHGLLTADFTGTFSNSPTVSGGNGNGDDVSFTFGSISTPTDGNTNNNAFLILVNALVSNVATNIGYGTGTILSNTATLDIIGDARAAQISNQVDVQVVEPNLSIVKNIVQPLANAGDRLTITLTVTNSGLSAAYDVEVEDNLLAADYDWSSIELGIAGTDYPASFRASFDALTGRAAWSGGTVAAGQNIVLTFTAKLNNNVAPDAILTNTASLTSSSTLEFDEPNERNNTDPDNNGNDIASDDVRVRGNSLSGFVYNDLNNDGQFDANESGIANVVVRLQGIDHLGNQVNLTAQTNADGLYAFDHLRAGTYRIIQTQPSIALNGRDYLDGSDSLGTLGGTQVADDTFQINLPSNSELDGLNYNFGELEESELRGFVWNDADNDGVYDNNESGIAGVTITLSGTDDRGTVTPRTVMTQADGSYSFDRLRPGEYVLAEVQPVFLSPTGRRYLDGLDRDGSLANGDASINDRISSIDIRTSTLGANYNFAEITEAVISGYVYYDSNNDGLRIGEVGIAGVELTLTGTNDLGQLIQLSTTSAIGNGYYEFSGLRPSDLVGYTITQTSLMAGYLDGIDSVGTAGGTLANDMFSAIVFSAGANGTEYNFGELLPSSLSGTVFLDLNNDGTQDAGERGLADVWLQLTGVDDRGQAVSLSTRTDSNGQYLFDNLRPSNVVGYTITQTSSVAGYLDGIDSVGTAGGTLANDMFSAIVFSAGANGTEYNFGELLPSSLSGTVFLDLNNDGTQDAGERGLADVWLQLTGVDDRGQAVSLSTRTDSNGQYLFDNLRPSNVVGYTITQTSLMAGYLDGIDSVGTAGGTLANDMFSAIVFSAGANGTEYNFGELLPSSLSGTVFLDLNNDGTQDAGERGLADVWLQLTGVDDRGQAVSLSTRTDSNGQYLFDNLRPSNVVGYTITQTSSVAGYLDGIDSVGTAGGILANDMFSAIVFSAGANGTEYNFGELLPSSLSGTVFLDLNNDGTQDAGERGLADVWLQLTGVDDRGQAVSLSTRTDSNGQYLFDNLRPSNVVGYTITQTSSVAGYLDGIDSVGTAGGTLANDMFSAIVFSAGANGTEYNFGELLPSSLSGTVFLDLNNDGTQDAGERGLADVWLQLTGVDDRGQAVSLSTRTDSNGQYLFDNLRPSNVVGYTITQTSSVAGYLDGIDSVGTAGGTLANDMFSAIVFSAGANGTEYNFGELLPSSLSGTVFLDLNNDGTQDAGERGLADVWLQLTGVDDRGQAVSLSTRTDSNGQYLFDNLRPSNVVGYTITQTSLMAGYLDGIDSVGTAGGTLANDMFSAIVFSAGANGTEYNFGELLPSSLSGTVFLDLNNDGTQDAGERGLADVWLQLTGVDDRGQAVSLSTRTDSNGQYLFDNLRPSNVVGYTITQTSSVAGYLDGIDSVGTAGGTLANDMFSAIVFSAGANGTEYNFGELLPSSLSGTVFLDLNNDGTQDAGERGLADVWLQLTGVDDRGQAVSLSTRTDSNGQYLFDNLRPSNVVGYTITQTSSVAGYLDGIDSVGTAGGILANDMFSAIVFSAGANGTEYNFGELLPSSLSGTVFLDLNNDGTQDAGERGLADVWLQLTGVDDRGQAVSLSTRTDSNGQYLFDNLRPSNVVGYTITQTSSVAGYLDGIDSVGTAGGTLANDMFSAIVFSAGANGTEYNFGELLPSSLSGTVFLDLNNDGTQDAGERGLADVWLQLTGVDDRGQAVSLSTRTDSNGQYLFDNLRPSNVVGYRIEELQPAQYVDGIHRAGSLGGDASLVNVISGIVLASNSHGIGADFAELGVTVTGVVYLDEDRNGGLGTQENRRIAGVTVQLYDATGITLLATTVSDGDGRYSFANLSIDNYQVVQVEPAQYTSTNSATRLVDMAQISARQQDFGQTLWSLGDAVYLDANGNGTQESGERGLANVSVTLIYAGADGLFGNGDDTTRLTTTDHNGLYQFNELFNGSYRVVIANHSLPAGVIATVEPDDSNLALDGTANIILGGQDRRDVDFGFQGTGIIGDLVWLDANNDGVRQSFESGLANVSVRLQFAGTDGTLGTSDDELSITSTNANGEYRFEHLMAGQYRVTVDIQDMDLPQHVYLPSSALLVDLASSESRLDQDFAFIGQGSIGQRVYVDRLGDGGDFDSASGDQVIAGVKVQLEMDVDSDGTFDHVFATTTDAQGQYAFDHLLAATYRITVDASMLGSNIIPTSTYELDGAHDSQTIVALSTGENNQRVNFGYKTLPGNDSNNDTNNVSDNSSNNLNNNSNTNLNSNTNNNSSNNLTTNSSNLSNSSSNQDIRSTVIETPITNLFAFDSFHNYGQPPVQQARPDSFGYQASPTLIDRTLHVPPVDPIFSGLAEPGTTLSVRIYDANGRVIGERTVVADTGGNWIANFPGAIFTAHPDRMDIEQVPAIQAIGEEAGFSLRRFFQPAMHHSLFFTERPSVGAVMRDSAYSVVESMHEAHQRPLQIQWSSHLHELNAVSAMK